MKKLLKLPLLALFFGLTSLAFGQANTVDLDELASEIEANPEATAELVTAAVKSSPDQLVAITERLIAEFPNLTEEIIVGAIAGMPDLSEREISNFMARMIRFRPGLAPEIVLGARRATGAELHPVINQAAVDTLRQLAATGGAIGGAGGSSVAPEDYNDNLRVIISPAQLN